MTAAVPPNELQEAMAALIHVAAEIARRENMPDFDDYVWPKNAGRWMRRDVNTACHTASAQCSSWATCIKQQHDTIRYALLAMQRERITVIAPAMPESECIRYLQDHIKQLRIAAHNHELLLHGCRKQLADRDKMLDSAEDENDRLREKLAESERVCGELQAKESKK